VKILLKIGVPIAVALYFPLFGKIIPVLSQGLLLNFVHWSTVWLVLAIFVTLVARGKFSPINKHLLRLLQFNVFFGVCVLLKGAVTGAFQEAINLTAGVNISTLLVVFVTQQKEFGRGEDLFRIITATIGVMLVLQTVISALESAAGVFFGEYIVNVYGTIQDRDVLSVFGVSQESLFGFSIPFTGLIGAHNAFGIMLLFYAMFFLLEYEARKRKYNLLFILVVLFGLLGNGTRSALLLTFISVFLFLYYPVGKRISLLTVTSLLVVMSAVLLVFFELNIVQIIGNFYYQSDTMVYRVLLWGGLAERFVNLDSIPRALFGMQVQDIKMATVPVVGDMVSVESEYFRIYLTAGAIGLVLFIRVFGTFLTKRFRDLFPHGKLSMTLFGVNVFLISVVMTGVIFYAVYFIVTLTVLQAVHYKVLSENNETKRTSSR
jgi:hypothetical protein